MAFDWTSLINPAAALGAKALGDKIAPGADLQSVQNNQQQNQFNNQMALQRLGQSTQIRKSMMPGMYTALGFAPEEGQRMAASYGTQTPTTPGGLTGGGGSYTPGSAQQQPGGGSTLGTLGKVGLGALSIPGAAGALGGLIGGLGGTSAVSAGAGGLGATLTTAPHGLLGAIGGLGATGAATLGIGAAAGIGAILWRKSQAHPEANQWVQGEQNPFDKSMAAIDQQGLPPDQAQAAKQQNAQRYLTELQKFASQGGDKLQVARQAAATFRQWYGDPSKYGIQLGF